MTAANKLGTNFSISRITAGTFGSPTTYTPLIAARDIKMLRPPAANFDSSDRAGSFQTVIPTRFAPALEFDFIWNGGAGMTALRDAFVNGTPITLVALDGPPGASNVGMRGDWAVSGFPLEAPLLDGQKVKVSLKPHGNYTNLFDLNYTDTTVSPGSETQVAKKIGTNASLNDSTHAPITKVRDLKIMIEPGALFDSSDRVAGTGSYYIQTVIPTRKKVSLEFDLIWDSGVSQVTAFRTAFLAGTPLQMWALDGPYTTSGSWGVTGDFAVTLFDMDAPLLDGQKISVKCEPHGNYTNAVAFVTI